MQSSQTDWKQLLLAVGDLEDGFIEHRLPITDKLVDRQFNLFPDSTQEPLLLHFHSPTGLTWSDESSPKTYAAFEIRPDVFFIDWLEPDNIRASMSLIVDLVTQEVTSLQSLLPTPLEARQNIYDRIVQHNQMSAVRVTITHAGIGRPRVNVIHQRTKDLIGMRLKHTYSKNHIFEHIYLNEHFFAWQSLAGADKGMADTEPVNYLKIGADLYLFNWYERLVPWSGVLLMDLAAQRAVGKMHWYTDLEMFERLAYVTVGSHVQFLNETIYE
ncbi:MAG: hypothetical protein HC837_10225 [Chloroflexaceae bacterium]|nr:hypothetical protein [Chloroflexaceae bacterium]